MKYFVNKKHKKIKEKVIKVDRKVGKVIENVIYILILLPLVIASVHIAFQKIFYPEIIPDILGYKMFVILDENMDESVHVAVGISPKSKIPDLGNKVNEFISVLKAEGILDDMYDRWVNKGDESIPGNAEPGKADDPPMKGRSSAAL